MGNFYDYKCSKCGYENCFDEGFGMLDCVYMRKTKSDIQKGLIYAPKAVRMFARYPESILVPNGMYICPECKNMIGDKRYYGISICNPKDILNSKRLYFFPFGKPSCFRCNRQMILVKEITDIDEYLCPKCGSVMECTGGGFFD